MNEKSKKTRMPAIIGAVVLALGILTILICYLIENISSCNNSSCVYSLTGYFVPLVCLVIVVPYGLSLTTSGVVYYLIDKYIPIKKSHPYLWSLLLSAILFYPAHELVAYVVRLFLFR
ncbi:hypothetical protein IKZ77_03300 [Candidatus Saccharibacteria bacterium]|nr:hypothetical protein [Candidatus Saccharibacteria bacterium]